jgi:hypothetical protein
MGLWQLSAPRKPHILHLLGFTFQAEYETMIPHCHWQPIYAFGVPPNVP